MNKTLCICGGSSSCTIGLGFQSFLRLLAHCFFELITTLTTSLDFKL